MAPNRTAGVVVPLFSIRTRGDWGIGQIGDMPACAAWIRRAGHSVLQLLPPYELAAGETSPYGARTAFGLDPIYVTVEAVPDLDRAS
jgi:4-alpha-glucanotransferase